MPEVPGCQDCAMAGVISKTIDEFLVFNECVGPEEFEKKWGLIVEVGSVSVPETGGFEKSLPVGAEVFDYRLMVGVPTLFYAADPNEVKFETRKFAIAFIGTPMPEHVRYIGSIVIRSGGSSKHLFEVLKEQG